MRNDTARRNRAIVDAVKSGWTMNALSKEIGLSAERVRQICAKIEQEDASADPAGELSVRARNALLNSDIEVAPQAVAQIEACELLRIPNFGKALTLRSPALA